MDGEAAAAPSTTHPRFSLALGGGGARGIAHIVALEAMDELGVRPSFIAGCSIGAMMAAAYASGISGRELREHTTAILRNRMETARLILRRRPGRMRSLFDFNPFKGVFIDGDTLLDVVLPPGVARDFGGLQIPTIVIATDYYAREEHVFASGDLVQAVAASIALPALIAPQEIAGRVLVDGGLLNPLPVSHLLGRAEISMAVDVSANTSENGSGPPSTVDAMYGAVQIMQHAITQAHLKEHPADILIRPAVAGFRVLDFFKVDQILAACEPVRDDVKRQLDLAFSRASA